MPPPSNTNVYAALAALAGVCLALQAPANGAFRRTLETPLWATFFSVCGTILFAGVGMLLIRPPAPDLAKIQATAWWHWIGGPLGTMIVLAGALLTPRLGALTFLVCVVAGQVLTALLLDHFGLMGLAAKAVTPGRLGGVALVVAGVVCIRYS